MCEQYSISGRMEVLYKYKRALGGMNFLARDRQPTRIAADLAIPEIYLPQLRSEEMSIPNLWMSYEQAKTWGPMCTAGKFLSLDLDTLMSLVLRSLKMTIQSWPQAKTCARSLSSIEESSVRDASRLPSDEQKMVESSAYKATCDCRASARSLMKKRKRVGPKIDPCGTPELIKKTEDDWLSSTTLIWRLVRKSEMIAW